MKFKFVCVLAFCLLTAVGCRQTLPPNTPVETFAINSAPMQSEEVREAIFNACLELGWVPQDTTADVVRAALVVRNKHTVVVDIHYTPTSYDIQYVSSVNMNEKYKDGTIVLHPNYNKWVANLKHRINLKLGEQRK